ncbi:MAG: DUF2846 domain-containing protein [Cellvibrionaceae bacterium]
MKCWSRIVLLGYLSATLSGCAASGKLYEPRVLSNKSNALIYVLRSKLDEGEVLDPPIVYIGGHEIAALRKGGYTVVEVTPGHTTIQMKSAFLSVATYTGAAIDLEAEPGKTYYLGVRWYRPSPDYIVIGGDPYRLELLENEERAAYELRSYRLQPSKLEVIE